jgi:hypothetical protein
MPVDAEGILNDLIARVGRVRRWLLAISTLRIAALGLASVSLYVGLYAWLDHHVHFGRPGRVSAFIVFAALLAAGVYYVVRVLRREMTYANAANYIEDRHSFDQQLVAAVEYYEAKANYPYSQALAKQLVLQVSRAAEGCQFDSTVDKWQGYVLAGFVVVCLVVAGLFVRQNILYVSAYLARLVRPFSQVQPLAATTLEATTGDLIVAPDTPVTFNAAVQGRPPESATLVLTRREPNDANSTAPEVVERIDAQQTASALSAVKSFDRTGQYEYHFEAGDARSESHTIQVREPPAIESITASISPPPPEGAPPVQPYEQKVTGQTLEVLPGSRVELKVQATKPLREATAAGLESPPAVQQPAGADSFTVQFTADKPSSMTLGVTGTDGLANRAPQELRIVPKGDEPPQLELVSPDGDYLATDVASIPITFAVSDDFGIEAAQLYCELPGRGPMALATAAPQGARQAQLAHTLELEQYDLHAGDSVLFYARARDIDTGQRRADPNGCSDVYFVEIRPYQQYWHPLPGGPSQKSQPQGVPEDLITILEYTRGVLKKTWPLAHAPQVTAEEQAKLEALGADVQYCADLLVKTRDDPEAGFPDGDKAVLNQVLEHYKQAADRLGRYDAAAALPPEESAYRTLRKFIDERHLKWAPPDTGQSKPKQTPERVKLQEQPQEPRMEKERVESRLKEMQEKIDALARQQQSLKSDLDKALQQEKQGQSPAQSAGQAAPGQGSEGQGGGKSGQASAKDDATRSESSSESSNPTTEAQSPASAGGKPGRSAAEMDARLRMLQARQQALRAQTAQLGTELGHVPGPDAAGQSKAQSQAQEHINQAAETMQQLEEKLADARYESPASQEGGEMTRLAEAATRRLAQAGQAIQRGMSGDQQGATADQARDMAEQLARDAESYDESLSDAEKQQMRERLEAAEKLLESMAGPQWATISGGGPGAGHVYTKDTHAAPAEAARLLARQFWSVALEARQRQSRPLDEEPSDVEFFETENKYFEKAAQYRPPRNEP